LIGDLSGSGPLRGPERGMNQNSLWAGRPPSGSFKIRPGGEFFEPEGSNQVLALHHTKKGPIGALFGMAVEAVRSGFISYFELFSLAPT
jgi:hypothetical protein